MTTLVMGATGNVGPHVVSALHRRAAPVRVLARDPQRASERLPAGVDVVRGDFYDDASVRAAADGVEALFLLTPHAHDMAEVQIRVIRLLRRTGIRIVKLSGTSAAIRPDGPEVCRAHWEVEQVLASSGQPHVVLRPNAFMQTLLGQIMAPEVRTRAVIPNAVGSAGISLIDGVDIGEAAAEVLLDPQHEGRTYVLTGPRAVTFTEIHGLVCSVTGQDVQLVQITPADIGRATLNRGGEQWEADHFSEMYTLFRAGESAYVTDDVARLIGRAPRSVEDYVRDNQGLFLASEMAASRPTRAQ